MCLTKYDTKDEDIFGRDPTDEQNAIEIMQFYCTFTCVYSSHRNGIKIRDTNVNHTMIQSLCPAIERYPKSRVCTKTQHLKLFFSNFSTSKLLYFNFLPLSRTTVLSNTTPHQPSMMRIISAC